MNRFLVFSSPEIDTRCKVCKNHTYLVWSMSSDNVNVIHTHIHVLDGVHFPYLANQEGIHWWRSNLEIPECLKSYKTIGGK